MASFRTFDEHRRESPCSGCPAPCCRVQMVTYPAPAKFQDLDHARYRLLAPRAELVYAESGEWMLLHWLTCTLFEEGTCSCTVHATPAQPKVCVYANPWDCWYKRNLVDEPRSIVRFDLARFDAWLQAVTFGDDGTIASLPSYEESRELVAHLPIEPTLQEIPLEGGARVSRLEVEGG